MISMPPKKAAVLTQYPVTSPYRSMRASAPLKKISTNDTYSMTPAEKPVAIDRKR